MHHHESALAPRQRHDVEHLPVVEPQQVICHVHLERGVAVADQRRQFLPEHLLRGIGDDQVKGIVDDRLGLGGGVVFGDDFAQGLAAMLRRKRDDSRRAAERRRHRRAVEIVGAHDPGRGFLLDMAMAVDRAGQNELAAGVDVARAGREPLAECHDRAAAHADVALRRVGGGRDRAVADHQIVVGHPMFLMIARAIARSSATRNALRRGIAITRLLPPGSARKARSLPRPRNTPTPAP